MFLKKIDALTVSGQKTAMGKLPILMAGEIKMFLKKIDALTVLGQ
jgi:hypothetical protein